MKQLIYRHKNKVINYSNRFKKGPVVSEDFKMTVDTTESGSATDTFVLPLDGTSTYNFNVDWGDGNTETITSNTDVSHTYSTSGIYQISINGTFPHIYFNAGGDRLKLMSIDNWGSIQWESMEYAFTSCENMNIKAVDTAITDSVTSMSSMFDGCTSLNGPVNLITSNVIDMSFMFFGCESFNQPIDHFDLSNVESLYSTFENCYSFNQPINFYETLKNDDWDFTFGNCTSLDQEINITMNNPFYSDMTFWNCSSLNSPINIYGYTEGLYGTFQDCISLNSNVYIESNNIKEFNFIFSGCINFNQPLDFDTPEATYLSGMFDGCSSFNQPINLSTSNVISVSSMFEGCTSFNQPIDHIDTSSIQDFSWMFEGCTSFNQTVNFDTSKSTSYRSMFEGCSSFKQDISHFDISNNPITFNWLKGCDINETGTSTNYDNFLVSLAQQSNDYGITNKNTHAGTSKYSRTGQDARDILTDDNGWTITDGGLIDLPFKMTVDTTESGSATDTFVLPLDGTSTYDFDVDWGDGNTETVTSNTNVTHTYSTSGTYQIKISRVFPHIYFSYGGDRLKVMSIDDWGTIEWKSLQNAFFGCENMTGDYQYDPDMSGVDNMDYAFTACFNFNGDIQFYNLQSLTTAKYMLQDCTSFNKYIKMEGTSNLTDVNSMLKGCSNFNNIVDMDTSSIVNMTGMFDGCSLLDEYDVISNFDTTSLQQMPGMFNNCSSLTNININLNTPNLTNMNSAFYGCSNLNPDTFILSDTSKVFNMSYTFYNCSSLKNDFSWLDISNEPSMDSMFFGCNLNETGTTNYDNLLNSFEQQTIANNLTVMIFHGGNSQYSDTGETSRNVLINDYDWYITDGGHI